MELCKSDCKFRDMLPAMSHDNLQKFTFFFPCCVNVFMTILYVQVHREIEGIRSSGVVILGGFKQHSIDV